MSHINTCAQKEKILCPSKVSLHGEKPTEHWWSGWPGAFCLKCGSEDKDEVCLIGCECPCHQEFWESFKNAYELKQWTNSQSSAQWLPTSARVVN